jgi:hypothetical protein
LHKKAWMGANREKNSGQMPLVFSWMQYVAFSYVVAVSRFVTIWLLLILLFIRWAVALMKKSTENSKVKRKTYLAHLRNFLYMRSFLSLSEFGNRLINEASANWLKIPTDTQINQSIDQRSIYQTITGYRSIYLLQRRKTRRSTY